MPCGIHRNELYYATVFSIAEKTGGSNAVNVPLGIGMSLNPAVYLLLAEPGQAYGIREGKNTVPNKGGVVGQPRFSASFFQSFFSGILCDQHQLIFEVHEVSPFPASFCCTGLPLHFPVEIICGSRPVDETPESSLPPEGYHSRFCGLYQKDTL